MEALFVILLVLALLLAVVGVLGSFIPGVPGPPLSLVSLYIVFFAHEPRIISPWVLVIATIITIVIQVFDYVAPVWLTKLGGGSKAATWGSTIGIVVGMFYMPLGLIFCPLLGAFIGELISSKKFWQSVKVALMAFVSYLLTSGMKLIFTLTSFLYLVGSLAYHLWISA